VSVSADRLDTGDGRIIPTIEQRDLMTTRERRLDQMSTEESCATEDQELHY